MLQRTIRVAYDCFPYKLPFGFNWQIVIKRDVITNRFRSIHKRAVINVLFVMHKVALTDNMLTG